MNEGTLIVTTARLTVFSHEKYDLTAIGQFFRHVHTGYGTNGSMEYSQWKIIDKPVKSGLIKLMRTSTAMGECQTANN
jgi:hypothetical protein